MAATDHKERRSARALSLSLRLGVRTGPRGPSAARARRAHATSLMLEPRSTMDVPRASIRMGTQPHDVLMM